MKFLSELGSCWGVAPVTPAVETTPSAVTPRKQEEVVGRLGNNNSHAQEEEARPRGLKKVKSTSRHWKPSLNMISEDNTMVSDMERRSKVGSRDEFSPKVKPKSSGKAKPIYHGEDFWKSSNLWAIPAFAPSPF